MRKYVRNVVVLLVATAVVVLGIIRGYSLCAENEEREKEEVKMK